MSRAAIIFAGALAIIGVGLAVSATTPDPASGLKPVSDFASIANEKQRSLALFGEAGKVITSPRCMNCHPAGDRPAQGDDRHPHLPLVVRGVDGFGAIGMRCTTCHGPANFDPAQLPGHPNGTSRRSRWRGSASRWARSASRSRTPSATAASRWMISFTTWPKIRLYGWGWHPGAGRTPAPGTQAEFGALIKAWVDTGAVCPAT